MKSRKNLSARRLDESLSMWRIVWVLWAVLSFCVLAEPVPSVHADVVASPSGRRVHNSNLDAVTASPTLFPTRSPTRRPVVRATLRPTPAPTSPADDENNIEDDENNNNNNNVYYDEYSENPTLSPTRSPTHAPTHSFYVGLPLISPNETE
jgi:hypothetical protein